MARSTIATILKQHGIPPSDERQTSWQTFLTAAGCFRRHFQYAVPERDAARPAR